MNDFCDHCGKEIDGFHGFHTNLTRFCCDQHKIDYHNTKRKIERKITTIDKCLSELSDMLVDHELEGHYKSITDALLNIKNRKISPPDKSIWVRCMNCKDTYRIDRNLFGCPFCQSQKYADISIKDKSR